MEDSRLNRLPSEIKLIIFSKLPVESVLNSKLVCKSWRNLLRIGGDDNHFAYLHLRCQYGDGIDSSVMRFVSLNGRSLYYAEYYDKMNPKHFSTRRINHKFLTDTVNLVGSCNGLICLSVERIYKPLKLGYPDCYYDEPFYICNPITREIMNLPRICIDKKRIQKGVRIVHGFGYHPLTNEYKVIRISYYGAWVINPPCKGQVEVYTLGSSNGWRSKGDTDYSLKQVYEAASVCVNGALHWPQLGSRDIVAFDLADEEFRLLVHPRDATQRPEPFSCRLGVFRGCLCLVNQFLIDTTQWQWDFWFLKKNEEANRSCTTKEFYKNSPCWCKEYAMKFKYSKRTLQLTPYLFALSEGGQVLAVDIRGHVIHYDKADSLGEDIWSYAGEDIWSYAREDTKRPVVIHVPHMNSFVSLKALGENNVATLMTEEAEIKSPSSKKAKRSL